MSYRINKNRIEKVVGAALQKSGVHNVLAAVSGGADSVALLTALVSLRHVGVKALHCNFHLRGEESDRDMHSVEALCGRLGVELSVKHFDVEAWLRHHPGTSVEMACRDLRYEWFRNTLEETGAERLLTGHNADDNAETLLLNLFRGSGSGGLRGMRDDNGFVLRPLLGVHRSEIEEYLQERDLGFVVDSTNLHSDYRRNFLRNEIIPLLRTRWPGIDKALQRSLHCLSKDSDTVDRYVGEMLPAKGGFLEASAVLSFPAPELLVRRYISDMQPRTTTADEIVSAIKASKPDVKRWSLPGGTIELRGGKLLKIKR